MKKKFGSKWGDMLFPNAKRTNLKVPVPPISDLWKRCRMFSDHEQIGKKARSSRTHCWKCGALTLHDQRGRVFFASLPSRRLSGQCVGNPEI